MYLDFEMNDKNLGKLINNIRVKHDDIGIKDRGLADRLGELFAGIYSDFNQGAHAFGMYKGLFIKQANEYPEQDFFVEGTGNKSIPNRIIVHSLFTASLTSLRRIVDESRDWKDCVCIKNLQYKIENEIKMKVPDNQEVIEWFDGLGKKYKDATKKIDPILTYIDNRIAHHSRKWDKKLIQSTAFEIGAAFESVKAYNNAFRVFYENGEAGTMISEGERHAALFLSIYYKCKRHSDLRNAVIDLVLANSPEDHQESLINLKSTMFD